MLGKLATYLRMCGHDTAYVLDRSVEVESADSADDSGPVDDRLSEIAREEGRTLLTRDRDLAAGVDNAILLTERDVSGQLRELRTAGVELSLAERPSRCGNCNAPVERVLDDDSVPEYAPDPAETAVWRCPECGQHFWMGSHWDDVRERLSDL